MCGGGGGISVPEFVFNSGPGGGCCGPGGDFGGGSGKALILTVLQRKIPPGPPKPLSGTRTHARGPIFTIEIFTRSFH